MGSYALPALDIKPPQQQPNQLEQLGQLLQAKNMIAEQPVRQQILQQQAQSGSLQLQQDQQAQQDQQSFRNAMADPSMKGKTIGEVADTLASKGSLSPATYQQLKKADVEQRTALATLDDKQLANAAAAHKQTQDLYNNVMDLPDDQLAANWPSIAQQYDAIPGNQKIPLNPNQPLTKDQLKQFGPLVSMQESYLGAEQDKRKKAADIAETEANTAKTNLEVGQGGTLTDQNAFVMNWLKTKGLDNTPQNRLLGQQEYIKETKIAPAEVRVQGLMQMPIAVADPNNPGNTIYASRQNAIGQTAPNSADVKTPQAMNKYMTSGKGGQQLTAFNTAMQHLDVLDRLSNDLGNGNVQVFNKAAQSWAQATGNPAPTNFEAAKNAMAGEVASALKASGATDTEIEKVDGTFDRAQSPMQLKGAIATYRTLLKSKAHNLQQQYQQGSQGKPNFTDQGGDGGANDPFAAFGGKSH